ncbi:MAG: hypothetical protein Q8Q60_03880 [Candidatus Chromulinivorax sp.]|nr:hypothetical protein [Candidatus Chromulinivorax sp.]
MNKYLTFTNFLLLCCVLGYFYILYLDYNNLYYTQNELEEITNLLKQYKLHDIDPKAVLNFIELCAEMAVYVIAIWFFSRFLK